MKEKQVVDGLITEMATMEELIVLIAQTVMSEKIYIKTNIFKLINLKIFTNI